MQYIFIHLCAKIFDWLDGLATFYPELVTLETIGMTTDGNPMKLVKISVGKKGNDKPGVYIDAREQTCHQPTALILAAKRYSSDCTNYCLFLKFITVESGFLELWPPT